MLVEWPPSPRPRRFARSGPTFTRPSSPRWTADPIVVTGLNHIEGKTVIAVLDGMVEHGRMTLWGTGKQAIVVLSFQFRARTSFGRA